MASPTEGLKRVVITGEAGSPENQIAELTVNGNIYRDWESVLVKHAYNERPPYFFRFTCSEGTPLSKNILALQVKPGMFCTVKLAGILAFSGYIHTRQVFYDANRHYIEIQGASTLEVSLASAITKGQEYLNKTREQIIRDQLSSIGIGLDIEGGQLNSEPIEKKSVQPGISMYDFFDYLVRDGTKEGEAVNFTSNEHGQFVIAIGKGADTDTIMEGVDIIEARCIIFNPMIASGKPSLVGQRPANDQVHGPAAASIPFLKGTFDSMGLKLPIVLVNEGAAWSQQNLKDRFSSESGWNADDQITVNATVWGWLKPNKQLWRRGQTVVVRSPMMPMNDPLTLKIVTFTQDNTTGTRTLLDLRNEKALGQQKPSL